MIILVTGVPGSGKTSYAVDLFAHDPQFAERPKFVMGVNDLKIDHAPVPPIEEWVHFRQSPEDISLELPYFTFPENSVILIDEAQRVYRPRSIGSAVPPHVAAFETHRHTGVDFILITQAPNLIDANVRRLIGKHVHIRVTPFGRYKYEWTELGDPESASSRDISAKSRYTLPKRAFDLYKSSDAHTKIKTKLPAYFYVLVVAVILASYMAYKVYSRVSAVVQPVKAGEHKQGSDAKPSGLTVQTVTDPAEMLVLFDPRLKGKPETAPAFDSLRVVTSMPSVRGCVQYANKCKCLTEQGTDAGLDGMQCRDWLAKRPYDPYTPKEDKSKEDKSIAPNDAIVSQTIPPARDS